MLNSLTKCNICGILCQKWNTAIDKAENKVTGEIEAVRFN